MENARASSRPPFAPTPYPKDTPTAEQRGGGSITWTALAIVVAQVVADYAIQHSPAPKDIPVMWWRPFLQFLADYGAAIGVVLATIGVFWQTRLLRLRQAVWTTALDNANKQAREFYDDREAAVSAVEKPLLAKIAELGALVDRVARDKRAQFALVSARVREYQQQAIQMSRKDIPLSDLEYWIDRVSVEGCMLFEPDMQREWRDCFRRVNYAPPQKPRAIAGDIAQSIGGFADTLGLDDIAEQHEVKK